MERSELNWQIEHFVIPKEITPDYYSVYFSNDHCCGPGGSDGGDRNLYIDWIVVPGKLFSAQDGRQRSGCENRNRNPGYLYCNGSVKLKTFDELIASSFPKDPDATISPALRVERIAFEWAKSFERRENWTDFRIALLNPQFKEIQLDAMIVDVVVQKSDIGVRTFLKIREGNCFPNCFGGAMPKSASVNKNTGERSVQFLLSGPERKKEKRQWDELNDTQREFVAALWVNIPNMLKEIKKSRNWRERNGEEKIAGWKPIFQKIDVLLSKSRYAALAKNSPITLYQPEKPSDGMMQMMSGVGNTGPAFLIGHPAQGMNWKNFPITENELLPANFFLAARPVSASFNSKSLQDIFADPIFNLK